MPRRTASPRSGSGSITCCPGGPGTFHGRVPAVEVFLAYVAAATNHIAVGTGVKVLSTNSARRSAEEMAMLSLLAPGRVEFGLGQGLTLPGAADTRAEKAAQYGVLLAEIIATLRGEMPFSLAPCPEVVDQIWVAARDEPTLEFAAEHGLNLVIGQAEIGVRQADYVRRYRASGGRGSVRGARIAFVTETPAEAGDRLRRGNGALFPRPRLQKLPRAGGGGRAAAADRAHAR